MAFVQKRTYGEIKRREAKGTRDNSINAKTTYGEIKAREKEQKPYEPSEYDQGGSFIDYLLGRSKNKELLKRQNTVKKMDNQNAATILLQQNKKRDQLADAAKARAGFVNQYTFGQLPEINKRNAEYQAQQKRNERVDALLKKQDTVKNWQGKNAGVISAEKKQQNTVGADELKSIASKASATDAIGQYGKGNIDLWNRPVVKNGDGSVSTVKSFSTNIDGKEVLLPLIVNGKEVSEEEAIQHYLDTGEYLGKFDSIADADAYGRMLHNQQEALYGSGAGGNRFSVEDVDADFDALKKAQEREPLTGKQFDQASLDAQLADPNSRLNRYKRITTMNQLGLTPDPANIPATVEWISEMQDLGLLNDSDDPMYWTDWKIQHTIEENNKKIAEIEARNDELKEKNQAERDEEVQGTYDLQQKATIYKNLADYGVPISWGPDQYFFMGSNVEESHVKERPEDYWQDGRRGEYDRGLYDYINGEGAYDSRIRSMTTEDEQMALDAEMDQLWSAIEDGSIRNMADQAIGEYTEDAAKYGVGTEELYRQNEMLEDLLDQRLTQKNYMAMAEGGDTAYHPEAIKTNEVDDNAYTRMVEAEMMGIPFVGTSFVGGKYQDGDEIDKIYFDVNNPFGDLEGQIQDWKYDGTLWENLQRVSEAYFMTQEQKDAFNSLYNAGKREEAKAFYDALNRSYLSQMKMNYREDTLGKLASGKEGWQMGLYTIFSKMANDTMATYGSIRALLGDKEYQDKKNPIYQGVREDQIVRNNRIKAWGNKFAEWFGEDARGTGEWLGEQNFSLWDNVFRTVVSAGFGGSGTTGAILNELMMGDEVFGESMYEALSEDKSLTESFVVSLGRSLVESLTEHMGWDALFNADIKDVLSSGWKFAKYLGMNFASEAAEEATSHVMDTLLDEAAATIWNHRSELMEKMDYYMKQEGLTQEEASNRVWTEWLEEGGLAALGGGLTGLLSSGGYAGMARASYGSQTKQLGRDVLNRGLEDLKQNIKPGANLGEETKNLQIGNLNTIIDASSKLGENTESRKTAESIQEDMRIGKGIDLKKVGELVRNISMETSEEIGKIAKNVLGDTIKDQLTEKGVKANKAGALSDTLVRLITGDYTEEDMKMLVRSKEAQSLLAEYGMGQHDDQLNELKERTKEIAETRNSVMEMMVDPKQTARGITEKAIGDLMKGAKWATAEEITAADAAGGKTGKATEIIHDGKYAEITGFGTREVTEDGKKIPVATVTLSNGKTVDLTDIRPTSETQAQILQFVQSDSGSTIMAETGKALMQIGGKVQNIASAVTDTVNIVFDMFTGKQNTKTKLDTATEQEIRTAVQKDMDAADAARLNNYVELKPGQGKTTFKGVVYGSKAFDEALKAAGFSKSLRNEANAIASISKSLGTNVELYYDANESGNQGAFYGGKGIRINLAGTYNAEGVHRSALATFAHEVTHNLEANSAEAYKGLRRFVLQNLGKMGMNLQGELRRIMGNYAAHNENINLSGAVAEIVAMGSEQVLTNENVVRQLKEEDPSLFGKVKGAVQEMLNRIRMARNTTQETSSRYAKALQAVNDQVGKIWLEAAKEAQGAKGVAVGIGTAQNAFRDEEGNEIAFTEEIKNKNRNTVAASKPIIEIDQETIDRFKGGDLLTKGAEYFDEIGRIARNNVLGNVELANSGLRHWIGKGDATTIKARTIPAIKAVIEKGEVVHIDNQHKGKPVDTAVVAGKVKMPDGQYYVGVIVAQDNGGTRGQKNRYSFHNAIVIKEGNSEGSMVYTAEAADSVTSSAVSSVISILRDIEKRNSQKFIQEDQDQAYAEAVERGDWREAERMLLEKMQKTPGITGYNAPHFYAGEHKDIAKMIKSGDAETIRQVVEDMAPRIPDNAVLIPMPPHEGKVLDATDTYILANALSKATGAPVVKALESDYHESRYKAKAAGDRSVNAQSMGFRQVAEIPEGKMPVFIDNMVGGGQTAMAAMNAIGRGITLAYAQSSRSKSQGVKFTSVTYDENGKLIPLSQRMDPNNKSWKYSFQDDQDYMAAVNAGDMGTAQRMVEEAAKAAGYTKKVYHGTPTGGFTVFRDWSYFTENKDYADRYQNASASSIRGSYETTNPMTYALYMNPGKVFDTRKPAAAKLYNEARMEYGLGELGNTDSGLPDWTDGRDIIEFIEDRGLDYDTILLDEGGDPGENGPTKRGISYVTRANNVKNADPVTYDSKGKIVKLSDRFNRESNNIQFSMQDPVEVNKAGLIAVHNLTWENLWDTLEEGGFTAPSIAVILAKMGHTKYGEISAVFKPSAIDPEQNSRNKIYGFDAYTPTRYNAHVETELKYNKLNEISSEIAKNVAGLDDHFTHEIERWFSERAYREVTTKTPQGMAEEGYNNEALMAAYLKSQGKEVPLKTRERFVNTDLRAEDMETYQKAFELILNNADVLQFIEDVEHMSGKNLIDKYAEMIAPANERIQTLITLWNEKHVDLAGKTLMRWLKRTRDYIQGGSEKVTEPDWFETRKAMWEIVDKNDFVKWLADKITPMFGQKGIRNNLDPFTYAGNSRTFKQLHMPYTIENVVKAMYENAKQKGEGARYAKGTAATASKEYRNLQEVRDDAGRLQQFKSEEEYDAIFDELDVRMRELGEEIMPGNTSYFDEAMVDAGRYYARNQTLDAIRRGFKENDVTATKSQLMKAKELLDDLREVPTGYFEAKPERVSGFDELYKIIIPENAGDKMFRELEENNIPYETYNGTEEDRLRILNEQTDAQFSFMDETDVDARAWMETVNENSLQTEAEKQLLRNFKSLRMRVSIKQEQERNIQEEIRRLKDVLNGGGEGAAIETIENALEAIGIGIKYTRTAKYITKDGAIIGKMAGRNGVRLNSSQAAVAAELEKAGFGYDKLTNVWTYTNKSRRTMGQTQIEQKLKGLQTRLEKATQEKQAAQDELAKITSSNGYASLMYRQQRVLNDFVYGRTQDEVRGAVDRLEKSAANIAKRIEEEQRKAEEQAKNSVVQRFREILGTTTVDQTAAALKKRYNSTWTKNQLKTYLEPIILKMKTGEDFESDVETLAGILVNSDSTNTYEELSGLRGLVITLGPGAQQELRASNSSLKEIRARLAGTGIQVKFGERSSLETDIEDLRAEYPSIPELGDEKDALENFVRWVEGMKSQSAANEFYEQRIAETMAVITQQAAGAAKGIYMPTDPKAAKQVLAMMEFVKTLSAETQAAQKMLQDVAKDMEELQKAGRQASGMAVTLTHDATTAIDYFNRMARIAEDQAKQKTRKDLIEQLKSDFAQKVAKNNEEWRNLIERDAQARKQMEKNMSSRGQINTVVKRLYDLLKNPKGTRNIPEHMQGLAREIVGVIVENDLSEMKHKISRIDKKNLMEAQRVLQAWEARDGKFDMSDLLNMDPENASMLVINQDLEQIYDGIEKYNQEIKGKNKLDTLQQRGEILTQIQEAMSEIYTAIRAEGEVFLRGRKVATEDAAAEVVNGTGGKKYREWTGTAGRALAMMHKAIVSGNMTPEYYFRTIGNKGLTDLWENYHAAENRNGLELAKAKARLDEIAKKHGYEKWDTKERHTVHLMNGDVQMTLGQIMALWATWNRENTLGPEMSNHLTGGGFYVEQQDLRDGFLGRTTVEKKAIKLAETDFETGYNPDVATIESMMTQEQKDYVNDIVQFMSSDMSVMGNEASMAAYGIRMYKEKYYFPFQMWDGIKNKKSNEAAQGANMNRAFHPSFSHSKQHGANNALVIGDFTQTAADHIAGMINYATMGLADDSLEKVLNQQVQEGGELDKTKRNIRVILEEAYGQEALQYLTELQRQLNGGAVRVDKSFYDKLISLFRKNAVAGSLSVAMQQPMSYIRAAMMINPKYLAQAINPVYWKGSYLEMMAHSGVAVIKDMGRFDMNFGQSAREYLMPESKEGKIKRTWDFITEGATILPQLADRATWTRMWSACKAEQAAMHPEMDTKSDEFLDMVGVRFNDLMRRTQVYDSVLVKSANMRNQNPGMKMFTSFMAEPTLTMNVLADAVRAAKSGEKGGKALLLKAVPTFMLSAVLQAAIKGLLGAGRNPDEDKNEWENFLYRFWGNLFSEVDPLTLIPGFSTTIDLLKGSEISDNALGAVGKIYTAGETGINALLGHKSRGWYRDLEDSAGQIIQLFTKLPMKNLMRDGRAMYNFVTGKIESASPYAWRPTNLAVTGYQFWDEFMTADNLIGVFNKYLGEAGYQTDNTAYYKRVYQAMKEGDQKKQADLIDYLLTGKGVKKEDTIWSKVQGFIKEEYGEEKIDRKEAEKLMKEANPGIEDKDLLKNLDEVDYEKKNGEVSSYSNYTPVYAAMDKNDGKAFKEAKKHLIDNGYKESDVNSEIKTHIMKQYKTGKLNRAQTEDKLKSYAGITDKNDLWWAIDRVDYQMETGADSAPTSYVYRLKDAVNANDAKMIQKAVKDMMDHGRTKEQVKISLSDWKSDYLAADSNGRVRIKDALQKAYRVAGYTAEDADKTISKWVKDAKKKKNK